METHGQISRFGYIAMLAIAIGCGGSTDSDGQDAGRSPDAKVAADAMTGQSEFLAIVGQRCSPETRSGLVTISGSGDSRYVSVSLFDKASPLFGAPFLSDSSCEFHKFTQTAPCSICETGEICSMSGVCTPEPRPASNGTLILRSAGTEQLFSLDALTGRADGEITIGVGPISIELSGFGQTVTAPEMGVPSELAGLQGTLSGSYESPSAVNITWTNPQEDSSVFTHIPVNHHASGPIFTECTVPSSDESLQVDGPMLQPLAVITGLEFQGIEHSRFAAVDTSIGCIEFRFTRQHFVNLGLLFYSVFY